MKAMILAAGRGMRMRPLTDTCPKPLLMAGKHSLIEHHIFNLVNAGINEIIINHAWLGEKIVAQLGDGAKYGAKIQYSAENQALETAGGIVKALDFFENQPFLVINGDIWTSWDATQAFSMVTVLDNNVLANLLLVDNPEHNPAGDFELLPNGLLQANNITGDKYTFAGVAVYQPQLFKSIKSGQPLALAPLLKNAMANKQIHGIHYSGQWFDIGTPARLATLNKILN